MNRLALLPSRNLMFVLLLVAVAVVACRGKTPHRPLASDGHEPKREGEMARSPGLTIRLGEADAMIAAPERPKVIGGPALDVGRIRTLLGRLPPLPASTADVRPFALRKGSPPPPRSGETVTAVFPPAKTAEVPSSTRPGPLRVLRRAPEGEVPIAPRLSVTFSQPMVPVTALDRTADNVPIRLSPQPAGKWRWIGSQTLLFEPRDRFPMATRYEVSIAKGTRSAIDGRLDAPVSWTFSTPPPKTVRTWPEGGPVVLEPIVFVEFDQRVDPAKVLERVSFRSPTRRFGARLAKTAELDSDPAVRSLAEHAEPGRWVALRPTSALPYDAAIEVVLEEGLPSAEGPSRTKKRQSFSFRTHGKLAISGHRCGWSNDCPPATPWIIELTNPLDAERFDERWIEITPALDDPRIAVYGNVIEIHGPSEPKRHYKVRVSSQLRDVFGQTLADDETLRFRVDRAPPAFHVPGGPLVTIEPAARGKLPLFVHGHREIRVRAWSVGPQDFPAFLDALKTYYEDRRIQRIPGRMVIDREQAVGASDALEEITVDVSQALGGSRGHAIVVIEPLPQPRDRWQQSHFLAWIQATDIGLSAFVDTTGMLAWASSLASGRPLDGVALELVPGKSGAQTGADGTARIELGSVGGKLLVARKGDDVAILAEAVDPWSAEGSWRRQVDPQQLRWLVFDDRGLYRPGERVRLKGWLRRADLRPSGDLEPAPAKTRRLLWRLRDAQGNETAKGSASLDPFGGFHIAIDLPSAMNLGYATLELDAEGSTVDGRQYWHAIQVQEFRRPEYEVKASLSEGPHLVGEHAVATVSADYYAGGPLADATVEWMVTSSLGQYTPPGRDDWTFGRHVPWWLPWHGGGFGFPHDPTMAPRSEQFASRTDGGGRHRLRMDFLSAWPSLPMVLDVQATVTDVNRQAWSTSVGGLVHSASLYIGLKTDRAFVQQGEPIELDALVVDLEGRAVQGRRATIEAARLDWVQKRGQWTEVEKDATTCKITSGPDAVRCTFRPKKGGQYRIRATVTDQRDRENLTEMRIWVAGGDVLPRRDVEADAVLLIPDKKTHAPGERARLLVVAPFANAEAVMTLRRWGMVESRRFRVEGTSHILEIPIEDALTPGVHVQVDLVGVAPRTGLDGIREPKLPPRPARATGTVMLAIEPVRRTLSLTVDPRQSKVAPGGKTIVDVGVRDPAGNPVKRAQVAIVVVDEAVLALSGYQLPDPLQVFYGPPDAGVRDHHLRDTIVLARPDGAAAEGAVSDTAVGGAIAAGGLPGFRQGKAVAEESAPAAPPTPAGMVQQSAGRAGTDAVSPIAVRRDFDALAVFAPDVRTDDHGQAKVEVQLPDNLTRYRVMAIAVEGTRRYGKAESTITARLPLMVRPSPPRFLNFGDEAEIPVVLQNQTEQGLSVDVAMRASSVKLTGHSGVRVSVPAGDRVEVRFPAQPQVVGTARFQVVAASGDFTDAAEFSLPVWTPATTEAFATYGELDSGAVVQPVRAPDAVFTEFGGLEVTTSSTALQALTDAVLYLYRYPFDCSEQIASRIMAIAALRDVLSAFGAAGLPSPSEIRATVADDLRRLEQMQSHDGGFSFWGHDRPSWPWISIHVTHALERARAKGFSVPEAMRSRAQGYLRDIERHLPADYPEDAKRVLQAYALYVRRLAGDRDVAAARKLIPRGALDRVPLEALGLLLVVVAGDPVADDILRHLDNRVSETAASAHFVTGYRDGEHLLLHSDRRADAIVLEALMLVQPSHDLVVKLVRGLLDHRKAGRWESTQENAFVLLALDRYFHDYEKVTPDFVAKAWLGDGYAGDHRFRGRTTERHHIDIPMDVVAKAGDTRLTLTKQGSGRLYYRIGMRYAPADLKLPALDAGFTVERRYEAADDPTAVRRDPNGIWHFRAGATVRVRVTMVVPARRHHVALVDPLPAGLEPLNPVLATTGRRPADEDTIPDRGGPWSWWGPWYEHQNLRDERAEAFASLLWDGVYEYVYLARATTPGRFVVPAPKAEEMYHPETFGRGNIDHVIVE